MNESLFYMYAKIENISFDEFDITLKNTNAVEFTKENKKFSKNVNTIILSTKVTSKVTTEGAINLESGNNCYELEPSQLSLNITNSANPIVVKNTLFSPRNFTLIQNNVDDLNSISVNFTTSIFPVNLQCLLYCSNKNSLSLKSILLIHL